MSKERKIKAVITKPGLDGHDRGAKVIAHGLRDAGMEVIYTGLHLTPIDIVNTVLQEDPDVLLVSILSGAHNILMPEIVKLMRKEGINDVLVLGGGIIPQSDIQFLKDQGIAEVFGPGNSMKDIVEYIKSHLKR